VDHSRQIHLPQFPTSCSSLDPILVPQFPTPYSSLDSKLVPPQRALAMDTPLIPPLCSVAITVAMRSSAATTSTDASSGRYSLGRRRPRLGIHEQDGGLEGQIEEEQRSSIAVLRLWERSPVPVRAWRKRMKRFLFTRRWQFGCKLSCSAVCSAAELANRCSVFCTLFCPSFSDLASWIFDVQHRSAENFREARSWRVAEHALIY
jgi:hypothetical protein